MKKITVKWQVADGYAGKSRPQKTTINIEDYFTESEWNSMTLDSKIEHLQSFVEEDFEQKIMFEIEDYGI